MAYRIRRSCANGHTYTFMSDDQKDCARCHKEQLSKNLSKGSVVARGAR